MWSLNLGYTRFRTRKSYHSIVAEFKHQYTRPQSWVSLDLQETGIESQTLYQCTIDSDSVFTVQPNLQELTVSIFPVSMDLLINLVLHPL